MNVSLLNVNLIGHDAIGSVIIRMARYYREQGHDVRIFITAPPREVPDDIRQICRVTSLANLLRPRPEPGDPEGLFFHLTDLAIYNYPGYYDLLETIHGRERGAVLFAYYCTTPPALAGTAAERDLLLRGRAEAAHAHFADLSMVISEFGAGELRAEHGIPADRIRVVPLFPAHEGLSPAPKPADLVAQYGLKDARVILYVGRFAPSKDIATLVRALAGVAPRRPAARLLLVGDDRTAPMYRDHAAELRALAANLGVEDRVIFAGPVERIVDHYRLADLFVTASRHEGFCMPIVEAMACGVPVVAAASTALPSTVGDAGVLVEPGRVDDVVSAIGRLLDDDHVRGALREKGLARAAHFTAARFDERIGALTQDVMTHVARVPRSLASAAASRPRQVVICGTDSTALRLRAEALRRRDEILCYVDDDRDKQGHTFLGRPVVEAAAVASMQVDEVLVDTDGRTQQTMRLTAAGVPPQRIRALDVAPAPAALARVDGPLRAMRAALARSPGRIPRQRVVIFGAGACGAKAYAALVRVHDVVAFADNDPRKHGGEMHGTPVVSMAQLASVPYDRVIIASMHAGEIRRQLLAAGISGDRIEVFH